MILVTGGLGFIGSNFAINWCQKNRQIKEEKIINIDNLFYPYFNELNLRELNNFNNHIFIKEDINNQLKITEILFKYRPKIIIHFAAFTHVDTSIKNPEIFIQNNILGTFNLLESAKKYFHNLDYKEQNYFKFVYISTDEVYGSLDDEQNNENNKEAFKEEDFYRPNNPYSASKASAEHLVRSYYKTYNLPTIFTHASNIFGPRQIPEKLIPKTIKLVLNNQKLPIYGDGLQIRDWLFVDDFCSALFSILEKGKIEEIYNISTNNKKNKKTNLDVIKNICTILNKDYQIDFINDRLGHDKIYSLNSEKIRNELNWQSKISFDLALEKTINWYLNNPDYLK